MTVRIERSIELDAAPADVWAFISDPGKRASAISVVRDWETIDDETLWHIELPIPFVDRTVTVRTREIERVEGESVKFTGSSSVLHVIGEHELEPTDTGGTHLTNRFIVDGRFPGVEQYFKRNLNTELANLETALVHAVTNDP